MTQSGIELLAPGGDIAKVGIDDPSGFEHTAGPELIRYVPASNLIVLPQIRHEYDPDAIDALKSALDGHYRNPTSEFSIKLIHPPTVNVLDEDQFIGFLRDHGSYYKTEFDPSLYPTGPGGYYYVVISGNTRTITMKRMCSDAGVDLDSLGVKCSLELGMSFHDVNGDQGRENVYQEPTETDIAYSIEREYLYRVAMKRRLSQGPNYTSKTSIAEHFGYKVDKVRAALRYVELPQKLRDLVEDTNQEQPLVTYGVALALHPYMKAYSEFHSLDMGSQRVEDAIMVLVAKYMDDKLSTGTSLEKFKKLIGKHVDLLKSEVAFSEGEIMLFDQMPSSTNSRAELRMSQTKLAAAAIAALELVTAERPLPDGLAKRLHQISASIGATIVPSEIRGVEQEFVTVVPSDAQEASLF